MSELNKYQCVECKTIYNTPEDKAPPPINWSDGHKCNLIKIKEDDSKNSKKSV